MFWNNNNKKKLIVVLLVWIKGAPCSHTTCSVATYTHWACSVATYTHWACSVANVLQSGILHVVAVFQAQGPKKPLAPLGDGCHHFVLCWGRGRTKTFTVTMCVQWNPQMRTLSDQERVSWLEWHPDFKGEVFSIVLGQNKVSWWNKMSWFQGAHIWGFHRKLLVKITFFSYLYIDLKFKQVDIHPVATM